MSKHKPQQQLLQLILQIKQFYASIIEYRHFSIHAAVTVYNQYRQTDSGVKMNMVNSTTVRCPYLPDHVMHVDSLLTHLNRCKATNKHLFRHCEYNSLHVVPKGQYKQHIRSCEDAARFAANEDEEWGERARGVPMPARVEPDRDHSRESSGQSWSEEWFSEHSSDQGYGYYDNFDEYQGQSKKVRPNYSYNVGHQMPTMHQRQDCSHQKSMNKGRGVDFSFQGQDQHNSGFSKKPQQRNQYSDKETIEQSMTYSKGSGSRLIHFKEHSSSKYYNEDEDIRDLIGHIDHSGLKVPEPAYKGEQYDHFGDVLLEQAERMRRAKTGQDFDVSFRNSSRMVMQ